MNLKVVNLFVLKTTILILQSSISRLQTDMMADRSMIFTIQGPSRNWNISRTQVTVIVTVRAPVVMIVMMVTIVT